MKTILRSATIAIIFVAALLTAATASAQGIAPRVLILFDTSGSMLWDTQSNATHGDGSEDHPGLDTNGDGQPNDSKMFVAKEAVRDILINSGADIEFGLARFHQDEGIDILDEGSDGRRYREPINYSGWGACAQNTGGADILVDIGPNNRTQMLSWMDGVENFPNNKELRGTGWTPLALSLSDAWEHFSFQVIPATTSATAEASTSS